MKKERIIKKILENEKKANDIIFTKEKLESMNIEMLYIIYEASKSMITK